MTVKEMLKMTPRQWKEKFGIVTTNLGRKRRKAYLQRNRARLRNPAPTIISNNCIGGIMYSDLGLEFTSPTINLYLLADDFLKFADDLEYYITCVPEEDPENKEPFPVGILRKGDETIKLGFMHYKTFEEARDKWVERCKRVDLNNVYIVYQWESCVWPWSKAYKEFKRIKWKRKRLLTTPMFLFDREVVAVCRHRFRNYPGKSLMYPNRLSKKRYLDSFDYVSFFNEGW